MFQLVKPSREIERYVEYFWFGENRLEEKASFTHYATANSRTELLFHCEGDFITPDSRGNWQKVFAAGFYGQTNLYRRYTTFSKSSSIFGARLYPHAVRELFGVPAYELTNSAVDIGALLGSEGVRLAEQVFSSAPPAEKVAVVSNFVKRRINSAHRSCEKSNAVLRGIYSSNGQADLKEMINSICLSPRQFERRFKEFTGFSPSAYLKILRFETAVSAFENTKTSLTELALSCGYYDQSHFIRDFKSFSGATPKEYFGSLVSS